MGVLQQLRLLLNKNLLLRRRHPGILLLEVVWPILIVAIVALIRVAAPPQEHTTCHYQDRAMPSAGLVPFLQTFVCNLDNKCHSEESAQTAQQNAASVSALVSQITPYLADEGTLAMLDNIDKGVTLINSFNDLAEDNTLLEQLDNATSLARYFKDPDMLKTLLVTDYNFTQDAVDALMDSKANLTSLVEMSGYPDLKGVACHPERLSRFLIFPEGTNVTEVSRTLCDINESKIPEITDFLQRQLDVAEIIRLMGMFETLKERLNIPYTMGQGLNDVADMLDLLLSIDDLTSLVADLGSIKGLPDIIRNIPQWVDRLEESGSAVEPLQDFVTAMDPVVSQMFPNNSMWMSVKDGVMLGAYVTDLLAGNSSNATTGEFMKSVGVFIHDIQKAFNGLSPEVIQTLDAFSTVDWPHLWHLLSTATLDNQTALMEGLQQMEDILRETPLWGDIARYMLLANDLIHSANLVLHEVIAAQEGLIQLRDGGGELKEMMDMLLDKGPNVTLAVLKAFTQPDTLAVLLVDGPNFSDVCADVIEAIRDDIGQTTAQELNVTLCFGDASHAVNTVLGDFGVDNISMALNQTITRLASLFTGSVTEGSVNFVILWKEIQLMMYNLEQMGNITASSWAELFSVKDTLTDLVLNRSRSWEPVLDMLNENYLGSSVMSLLGAAGRVMNDSDSAQWMEANMGPYVHMATVMVKSLYTEMENMMTTYSLESPLGQLVYYGTNYAPEIMTSVMDMSSNGNMDAVYRIASSSDPLSMFCGEHMMQQMGLPYDVAVSMEEAICLANWTEVGEKVMSTQTTFSGMIQTVTEAMAGLNNKSNSFSMESDWRELTYYTSRVMDLMMSSQGSAGGDADPLMAALGMSGVLAEGPWTLVMNSNLSQVGVAIGMAMNRMQNLTEGDLNDFISIVARVMEGIDQRVKNETDVTSATVRDWRQLKHYFRIMDDVSTMITESSKQSTSSWLSLSEMLEMYPEDVTHMVTLAADAYLELIDALKNIILKPEQLIQQIVSEGLQAPNCENVTVTKYLMLAPDSSFGRLEMEVCTANWTAIAMELANTSMAQPVTDAVEDLTRQVMDLEKLELDPAVNWTEVLNNTVQSFNSMLTQLNGMEQMSSTWDLLPFNMTAINAKWADFYRDMDQLQNMDFDSLMAAVGKLEGMLTEKLYSQVPSNSVLMQTLSASLYLNIHLMDFVNIQLRYFNSTPEVNILDMLGSDEVRKMAEVLRYSPEINEIGVNTLIRVISTPEKASFVDPTLLCSNLTLFSDVVAVDNNIIDTQLLQQTVCNLNINFTLLVEELQQHWDGFAELTDAFELAMKPNASLSTNVSQLAEVQVEFTELLTSLTVHPLTIVLFDDDRWMNSSLYEGPWRRVWEELQNVVERYVGSNDTMDSLQSMMTTYLYTMASIPEMQSSLVYMDAILDMVLKYTTNMESIPQSFADYPNLNKMYSLVDQLPELMEMLAYTSMEHQEQLNNWGGAMQSWETFCAADPTTLMTAPPGGGLDVVDVLDRLCSINFTQLVTEANAYQGLDRLNALMADGNLTESVNVTALVEKMNTALTDLGSMDTTSLYMNSDLRFLNTSIWDAVFERLGKDLNETQEKLMSPEYLMQTLNNTLSMFPEFGGFEGTVKQVLAMADIILDQVLRSLQGGSLVEMFDGYPMVKSAASLLDSLPEIYETVMYTMLNAPDKLATGMDAFGSLETFCATDMSTIFTVPSAVDFDLGAWQTQFCSLNLTVLMNELAEYQGTEQIANMFAPNSTVTVNVTSVAQKMESVLSKLSQMVSGNATWVTFSARFLNASLWERANSNLEKWASDSTVLFWTSPQRLLQMLNNTASLFPEFGGFEGLAKQVLAMTDIILDQMLRSLQGGSLQEMFAEYPTLMSAAGLLDNLPEIYETVMYTMLYAPDKVATRMDAFSSLETFCATDMSTIFTVPSAVDFDLGAWQTQFCSLNLTVLMNELAEYQGTEQIANMFAPNSTVTVNITSIAEKMETVLDMLTQMENGSAPFVSFSARFLNTSLWERANSNLEKWTTNFTALFWMRTDKVMELYGDLAQQFPDLMQGLDFMQPTLSAMSLLFDKLMLYENKTSFTLDELFPGPQMQELVRLLEEPGVIEVLFESANSKQFEPLLSTNNLTATFEMLCTPSASLSQYLTVPDGVAIDLSSLKSHLCNLDPELLQQEAMDFLDIDRLTAALNGSIPVDYTAFSQQAGHVSELMLHWIESPPTLTLPTAWQNESFWLGLLENYAMSRQDPEAIIKELESFTDKLGELMTGDQLRQVALVAQTVMRLVNENLPALQNQNLTLENMVQRVPVLQEVFSALGVEGDVLDAMLKAPVQSGEMLMEALLASGTSAQESVCNITRLQDLLELPASFDTTALYRAVCLSNATEAVDNLVQNLDLQDLIDSLESPAAAANWSQIFQQSEELQRNLQDLIDHPPSFNASSLLDVLESSFNTSDMWQIASMFNYNQLAGLLDAFPELRALEGVMKSADVLAEFLDDMVNRLVVDGVTLDLASLFSSSPSFVRLMDAALHSQPNLVTALTLVQLNPSKVNELMALDPNSLISNLCAPSEFQKYFSLPAGANITEVLDVLCTLNYTQFVDELNENFMVDALTKKFAEAMNGSEPLNLQNYVATYMNLVERITTLAGVKNVTFDGNDLGRAFDVNTTRLLESLESVGSMLSTEYPYLASLSLDSVLAGLVNTSDGQAVILALKFVEVYLHSFNKALGDISSGPISLASIVNNTEVGNIIMPFLEKPYSLEDLLDLEVLPEKLSTLLTRADAADALCGPELFTAFAAPGNDSAVLRQLQTSVCNANTTVMMWQAVMGQANGYQLYQQMQLLSEEVAAGRVSVNVTAIDSDVQHLITMVTRIVQEYQNGSRSTEDLLDWRSFQDIFDRFSGSLEQRLMNMSQQWSTEMTMSVLNSLPDDPTSSMARTISTINIFMDIINDRMDDLLKNNVSLSTLLNHSDDLVRLMEAYLDVTRLSPQAWLDSKFNMDRVVEVSVNQTQLDQLCAAQTLAAYLADTHPVTTVTATMQTVLCSIATELPEAFRQFIDDQAISAELADIWNMSIPIQPEYQKYADNIERFNTLITRLATTPPGVDSGLSRQFDFTNMLDALQNIVTRPEMIFRLLKALGIALDGPLKSNDMDNLFYSLNAYVAQPLLNLVQSMDSAGVSLSAVMQDPSTLLEALPVLMNFHLQFDITTSIYLQPMMNKFWNNKDFRTNHFCNGSMPEELFTPLGLQPTVVNALCALPTTQWVQTLKGLNASDAQILAWVEKVEEFYTSFSQCYSDYDVAAGKWVEKCDDENLLDNKGLYWMRLMTTLESLVTHLVPDDDQGTATDVGDTMGRMWDILKDAFFNKTLQSAMNYMELVDRTGEKSEDWLVFKQVMKFLQSAGTLLNSGLHRMTDPSGTVYLQNLLPDSQKLADLLDNILGPTSTAELLAASVNPQLFYQLVYPDQLQSVACDPAQFSAMFVFPAGANVTAVQTGLCDALTSRSTSMQELIDLFQAGDMLVQLDRLVSGNYSSVAGKVDLWQALYTTMTDMVSSLEQLQNGQFNMTVGMTWLDPVLQKLPDLGQPSAFHLEAMCQNYITMLGGTEDFRSEQGDIVLVARIVSVASKVAPFITRLDELTCTMITDDGLDLGAGVEFLKQHGLAELLQSVSDLMVNGTEGKLQCSQLMETSTQLSAWITSLSQPPPPLDMDRLAECIEQSTPLFADVLQGLNQLYRVMADVSYLLGDDDIRTVLQNSGELGKILDFVLSIASEERSVVLQFTDLLRNATDVESYLTGVMKLAPEFVNSLLTSTINFNASSFLNSSVEEIADTLCQPALLAEVVNLPDFSPFNISAVSEYFCTSGVNFTAAVLKDAGQSMDFVGELTELLTQDNTGKFISGLTSNLVDLFSQLQSMSALAGMLGNGFDIQFLMENADSIDEILSAGGSIQKIVDSLSSLVGTLKYVVPQENHNIITDMQTFISGLVGLDLIQSRLLGATGIPVGPSVRVSDLQKDVPAVNEYLVDELNFSPEAASALLSSTYSIRVFLNASGLLETEEPCEERLRRYILLNSTESLEQEITSKFCAFNTTHLKDFMEVLVPQLDIGSLIQQYITYSGEGFLNSVNMTRDSMQVVFRSLSSGGQSLGKAADLLSNDNTTVAPLLSDFGDAAIGEFDAMVSLQPALCGMEKAVEDQFDLNSRVQGAQSEHDAEEEAQLNGEFCKEMYRSVKNAKLGSVIWSYLKPIISGKVLYTPDTPLAREIIGKAKWVFDTLHEVKRVAKKWSEKVPSLVTLSNSANGVSNLRETLQNGFVQGVLQATLGVQVDSVLEGLDTLDGNNMNSSSLKSLQLVAELVYNYSTCLDLDRFEAVATEAELERRAFELFTTKNFLGGIVFLNVGESGGSRGKRQADSSSSSLPTHIQYKIRMDMDNVPTTNRIKDRLWMPYAKDDFANDLRYMRGFIQLQDMVEGAILQLQTDGGYNTTGVLMQQMPFPCHREDDYIHFLGSYLLPMLMTFAWLAAMGIATHNLVYDRQSGQEESLRVMGMMAGLNFIAWLVVTVLIMAGVALVIAIIFKYSGIFHYSNLLLIFLFFLDFCLSTTLMCYFISSFFCRATLAILTVLIIYFISFLPYVVVVSLEAQLTMWQKTLASLSSTTAFSFGAMFITRFEEETTGLQWDNMSDKLSDSVDFAWMCYMMLIDSAIYLVLGWYIRNVKPGKYGVRQPWYFPVTMSYWCSCLSPPTETLSPLRDSAAQGLHQPPPSGLDIGISVRGLRKKFGSKNEVVHGIDIDIYHDQITTLLGHNGAAKTTTLNMLVGVLDPSAGTVLVEGKKTYGRTGLLGICPQHNIIFEYMTVEEHMEFYGGVKGHLSTMDTKREIHKLLHDVDLWHVKDVAATNLSGGMQRRLCVALAFVGGSKTVVLDEPTSGVDPHARKNIWNLIMKNRPGRTILMSTHHLDEADTLSDRILIMHMGRLLSVGSPSFLKDQLGGGYKLTMNTSPMVEVHNEMESASTSSASSSEDMSREHSKVMTFIKSIMPSAKFVESVGTDLTVGLPHQGDFSASLHRFFSNLDAQLGNLGVLSYGVSSTTLEEVFLKLTAEADNNSISSRGRSSTLSTETESISTENDNTKLRPSGSGPPKRTVKGASLKFQQLGALLLKRVHHYRRNWRMAFSTIFLPLLAFLCAMGFSTLRPTEDHMQSLIMSPALYTRVASDSYAFFKDNSRSSAAQHFMDMLTASPGIGTTCMGDYDPGNDFQCVAPGPMRESQKREQSCRCNDYVYECADGSQKEGVMQTMTRPKLILQDLGLKDVSQYLVTSYYQYINQRYGGWSLEPSSVSGNTSTPVARVWFNNKGYHAIPSYFNALSNNLLRTAVDPADASDYGITLYNHPLMLNGEQLTKESIEAGATDVGIAMVVLLALSFIPSAFMVYLTNERVFQERHMQSISGVGTTLYWFTSFLWDMFVYSCALAIMVVIVVIFKSDGFYDRENLGAFTLLVFLYGWAVIPLMYATLPFFKSGSSAYLTLFCANMLVGLLTSIAIFVFGLLDTSREMETTAEVLQYMFLIFPQFSLGHGLVELVTNEFQYQLLSRFGQDTYVSPYHKDMLGWKYVALGAQGVLFLILTFFVHARKKRAVGMSSGMHYGASKDDEDVFTEQERVRSGGSGDALCVKDICKVYRRGLKRFCAVNHLSFGVAKGECFGLLGVNGAGKTTTFKMLTGATTPSEGDAVIRNQHLNSLKGHLGDELGYCPQADALDPYMSGRETLHFHAKLRGFDSRLAKALVSEQLKRLQLESLADKPVHTYSGGNKRKLALAVAMLGDPPLLLLDEPTTGMDAATRRLAWKCITTATQRGQSVLLTSHSMDECDALCSRLAIMVNGQLKCIGSPQHLKNKFGDGYTVVLHVQGLSNNRYNVAESFVSQFPGSVIKVSLKMKHQVLGKETSGGDDQHHSVVEVSIPRGVGSVADIFAALQCAHTEHQIDCYSVSQTTLDTVFVNFAREQSDDGDHDLDEESSSGGSSSGRGSIVKDPNFHKSMLGSTYAYMNPEYSTGPLETFDPEDRAKGSVAPRSGVLGFENKAYDKETFSTKL